MASDEKSPPEPSSKFPEFHQAVKQGNVQLVKQLLDEGIDPDQHNWVANGRLPLLEAVLRHHVPIVRLLLQACCSVDATTFQGETGLHLAVESSPLCPEIVGMLLEAGADPGIPDRLMGNTALHTLVSKHVTAGRHVLDILQCLVSQCNVNAVNFDRCTALHKAVSASMDDHLVASRVQILLDGGANVNIQNNIGETPLHTAADNNLILVVKLLLKKGADVNIRDRYMMAPLHYAAIKNCSAIIRLLVEQPDCDVNVADLNGDTPLHLAAGKGHVQVVKVLIASKRVDANVSNNAGSLPIHKAIESGFVDVVEELLRVNCGVLEHTGYGLTPLDLACTEIVYHKRPEISQMLVRAAQNSVEQCSPVETDI